MRGNIRKLNEDQLSENGNQTVRENGNQTVRENPRKEL